MMSAKYLCITCTDSDDPTYAQAGLYDSVDAAINHMRETDHRTIPVFEYANPEEL